MLRERPIRTAANEVAETMQTAQEVLAAVQSLLQKLEDGIEVHLVVSGQVFPVQLRIKP